MFGIPGMTTGAVTLIFLFLSGATFWYVRGMADRKNAENGTVTAVSGASDVLFKNLTNQIDRLTVMLIAQDAKIVAQDVRIIEQDAKIRQQDKRILSQDKRVSTLERELSEARALVHQTEKDELGAIRAATQADISNLTILTDIGQREADD